MGYDRTWVYVNQNIKPQPAGRRTVRLFGSSEHNNKKEHQPKGKCSLTKNWQKILGKNYFLFFGFFRKFIFQSIKDAI